MDIATKPQGRKTDDTSTHGFSIATYLKVLAALILLTIATVAVSFVDLPAPWHIVAGALIATIKATLVVLIFMHALLSTRLTWGVIGGAVFWLSLLMVLISVDYLTRLQIPFSPGH